MKGLERLSLHIPISVDKAEIGTITQYFRFSGSLTYAGHFEYPCYHTKENTRKQLLRYLISAFTHNSTAYNPKCLRQGYFIASLPLKTIHLPVNQITWILTIYVAPRLKQREQVCCTTQAN